MMTKTNTVAHIYHHHLPALGGLTDHQREAFRNAIAAAFDAGRTAHIVDSMEPFDSEKQSEAVIAKAQIFEDMGEVPDDPALASEWYDAAFARLQEVA